MRPPSLHEHVSCVAAPAVWLSPRSGQIRGGADGLFVADRRALSRLVVTVDGVEPEPVAASSRAAGRVRFLAVVPGGGDPNVTVERIRTVVPDGGTEVITVHNLSRVPVAGTLEVAVASDLAPVAEVRARKETADLTGRAADGEVTWIAQDGYRVVLRGVTRLEMALAPGEVAATTLTVRAVPPRTSGFLPTAAQGGPPWAAAPLTVRSTDHRLDALVARGVDDLGALLLAEHGDLYCAAGCPWYLTLFGRDALWTARLALPLGHELAAGTLRVLARHQGVRHDPETEEEPGKVPHELRPAHAPARLPPVYYGTVDATPLWVCTLAEAWRWGMPEAEVAALLPAAERALAWLASFEGFVSYRGSPGMLVNQGWKDSPDAVQHADGSGAVPPVALCEVQAYAFEAAMRGADLLEAFGRPGADRWREWAARLAERFRARFWPDDRPAMALDGAGEPVGGLASNIGHLLGTGLLEAAEEERVTRELAELDSGWGLRTLTDRATGYNPLSYHLGSVWPHDTVITALGLVRAGQPALASSLLRGLVRAAPEFDYRLPELYAGYGTADPPVPYPAACRPQAWAAAVAPALVTALLGLEVDLPAGRLVSSPLPGWGELEVSGLRVGGSLRSFHVPP